MREELTASDVDALDVRWTVEDGRVEREVVFGAPPSRAQAILAAAVGVPLVSTLEMFAEGVISDGIRDWDGGGFDFSRSRETGTVIVWNAVDTEVEAPAPSFVSLMLRSVESALECRTGATDPQDPAWELLGACAAGLGDLARSSG